MKKALYFGGGFFLAGTLAVGLGLPAAMTFGQLFGQTDYKEGILPVSGNCGNAAKIVQVSKSTPKVSGWSKEQVANAAAIVQTGQELKVPPRGWVIAVATAMQESTLNNLGHLGAKNDHDSQGLFQQRPSQGWGTVEQIRDPKYAATKFYEKLLKVDGWQELKLTQAAQRVQISAYPNAYAKHETSAAKLVDALTDGAARVPASAKTIGQCASTGNAKTAGNAKDVKSEIAASGWVRPVQAAVGSAFRSRTRPNHHGVDLIAPKGRPVYAAASGTVIHAECDRHEYGYNCNRDGKPSDSGCGWYLDIRHAKGIITRYCHLLRKPLVGLGDQVKVGDQLGVVGTSGSSSGPHLHFEVHRGSRESDTATNPVKFMKEVGAPLGSNVKGESDTA